MKTAAGPARIVPVDLTSQYYCAPNYCAPSEASDPVSALFGLSHCATKICPEFSVPLPRMRPETFKTLALEASSGISAKTISLAPSVDGVAVSMTRFSGDFFSKFELMGGHHIFVIGDAVGHGLEAAVIARLCQGYLRSAVDAATSAAERLCPVDFLHRVMTRTNERLCEAAEKYKDRELFPLVALSAAYLNFNQDSSGGTFEVVIAAAGNPPPLIRTQADGSFFCPMLDGSRPLAGTLLGIGKEDLSVAYWSKGLSPDSSIYFFTDGASEVASRSLNIFDGLQKLAEVSEHGPITLCEFLGALDRHDDTTALLLELNRPAHFVRVAA